MRSSCPQPMASPLCIFRAAGGRGKYGKRNRNQIQWAGPVSICRAGPAYSCGFDNSALLKGGILYVIQNQNYAYEKE